MALPDIPTFAYQRPSSPWTDLRLSILKQLWTDNLSATKIAAEIYRVTRHLFSRSAILGMARRLKLARRQPAGGRPAKSHEEQLATRRVRRTYLKYASRPDYHAVPDLFEIQSSMVSFAGLTNHTCRWPIGDPADFDTLRFCGFDPHPGKPYCVRHCRMAYRSMETR